MKKYLLFFIIAAAFLIASSAFVKEQKPFGGPVTTIILLRHAEKDSNGDNPLLTVAGMQRAERLSSVFPDITPDEFYSTDFVRTRETIAPWAKQTSKDIQLYQTTNLPEFADKLKQKKGKTIVVVGHSNTIPPLVNLLLGKEKYENLADTEYSKVFVVTIKNENAKEMIVYY